MVDTASWTESEQSFHTNFMFSCFNWVELFTCVNEQIHSLKKKVK